MDKREDGGPAFPVSTSSEVNQVIGPYGHQDGSGTWQFPGMTLRDYFAAKAMLGILSNGRAGIDALLNSKREDLAAASYVLADSMLKARDA